MASKSNNDWQSTKKTVLQRNCHMFNNPLMSDISFTCGDSKRNCFYAHKYVLATSSEVFYAMFFGLLATKDTVIHLPDTDEESLKEFLRFLYTDNCTLTEDNAMKVMYLAKKYIVPSLTEKCVEVIQESLLPEDVFRVLEQALQLDEKELETKCWEVIEQQTNQVVTSEAFLHISKETLTNLLKLDTFDVSEVELFKAVLKWSDNQCRKKGLEATSKNRREVLGDAVYEIAFLSMSQKEFAEHVSFSGLLTPEEVESIYYMLNGFEASDSRWNKVERRTQRFARFSPADVSWVEGTIYCMSQQDRLCFTVNKPAKLHGVYLFGDADGSEHFLTLEVNSNQVITGTYTSKLDDDGFCGFDVMLPTPIPLDENDTVTLAATITNRSSSYLGRNGKTSMTVDGVTVTFGDSPPNTESNGTNKTSGRFYQIILEPT